MWLSPSMLSLDAVFEHWGEMYALLVVAPLKMRAVDKLLSEYND